MNFFDFLYTFWADYYDRDTIEQVWDGYKSSVGYEYVHLYEVNFNKNIDNINITFTDNFVQYDFSQPISSPNNDYPYAYAIDQSVVDVPVLTDDYENPTIILLDGEDYIIYPNSGIIAFKEEQTQPLWASEIHVDLNAIRDNFGDLIDFTQDYSSFSYLRKVQGLWYTLWAGPTVRNIEWGLNILMNAQFAYDDAIITSVDIQNHLITDSNLYNYEYVYDELNPVVQVDDLVDKYEKLTDVVEILDYLITPYWYAYHYENLPLYGYTDDYWEIKKYHHFAVYIKAIQVSLMGEDGLNAVINYLEKIKPSHTDYTLELVWEFEDDLSYCDDSDYTLENEIAFHDDMMNVCPIYNDHRGFLYGGAVYEQLPKYDGVYDYDGFIDYLPSTATPQLLGYIYPNQPIIRADTGLHADTNLIADSSQIYDAESYPLKYACPFENHEYDFEMQFTDDIQIIPEFEFSPEFVFTDDIDLNPTEEFSIHVDKRIRYLYNDSQHTLTYNGQINYNDYDIIEDIRVETG